MRTLLDRAYLAAAWLAALMMIGLLIMVMLSILGRMFNFYVPGTDAYAGYLMAGAGFLALAHTFKRGEHIRVTLLVNHVSHGLRHLLELWALAATAVLAATFAWYAVRLSWQSYTFHDISTGNDATPLWIPQISMALGALLFAVALLDELLGEWREHRLSRSHGSAREAT